MPPTLIDLFVLQKRAVRAIYNLDPTVSMRDKSKEIPYTNVSIGHCSCLSSSGGVLILLFLTFRHNYNSLINLMVNSTTEQILDFIEDNERLRGYPTRVHVSSNDTINGEYPLFITATQQKGISSWELPLVVQTSSTVMQFNDMARTLCPHDAGPNITYENRPTIQISTSNPSNVNVGIKLRRVEDFYVEIEKELTLVATPSSPKYYYFSFDNNPWNVTKLDHMKGLLPRFNYTIPKSVILIIESDDNLCAVVSIQNNS
ncbi:SID1 transmembrane family member 1-like, partial [Hyposmocoma kahamanoa]|uniref:SID1 transmembrane family member 1-like n=1 Tax=Hyposmocoma kahamanoa TaxID=1477025 RepID=UPI000E6D8871